MESITPETGISSLGANAAYPSFPGCIHDLSIGSKLYRVILALKHSHARESGIRMRRRFKHLNWIILLLLPSMISGV